MLLRVTLAAAVFFTVHASAKQPELKRPVDWFARAQTLMDLRTYDAEPFHLRATFHAFPGNELLSPGEKASIVTGDGYYEETWLGPHQWRREISLGDYHAVEQESARFRKMQASSEYEPLRVVMLMEALLYPIPRELTSQSSRYASGWGLSRVNVGDANLVRIAKSSGNQHADFTEAYFFLPSGALALTNRFGLITFRDDAKTFSGKLVARHLSVKGGDRELLSADITFESASPTYLIDELPGDPAPPWMTLRPLHAADVRPPDPPHPISGIIPSGTSWPPVFSYHAVLDRQGRYREAEMILVLNLSVGAERLTQLRRDHVHPAEIDGAPCQYLVMLRGW